MPDQLITCCVLRRKTSGWFARIRWRDESGKVRTQERKGRNKTEAEKIRRQFLERFEAGGSRAMRGDKATFRDLAEEFREKRLTAAVMVGERKVAGYKHPEKTAPRLKALQSYFGDRPIRSITYADLEEYKLYLLGKPTHKGRQRSIYDVHHHLKLLRLLLNYARQKAWLDRNPFDFGPPLINPADEIPRDRAERPGEEERLLAACYGRCAHMRLRIMMALDTALRPNEMPRLKRKDIDLENMIITARISTTKTGKSRLVPISHRLADELKQWLELIDVDADTPIFPTKEVKRAWKTVCKRASIDDLQFKDLRHWAVTRITIALAESRISQKFGMKVTGHTREETYRRYIKIDIATTQAVGRALERQRGNDGKLPPDNEPLSSFDD